VLYRAGISPHRLVKDIDLIETAVLFNWIQKVMKASYAQGGASIRNYQRLGGEMGAFVFEFEVYAQKTDPKGNVVIREETLDGRTTHWVPDVQR
jgi:formamidopyrimidine-DNA glycosylase